MYGIVRLMKLRRRAGKGRGERDTSLFFFLKKQKIEKLCEVSSPPKKIQTLKKVDLYKWGLDFVKFFDI